MWHYNLDGSFDDVVFQFIGSTSILTIVDKFDIDRDAAVPESVYQGRVREKNQCYSSRNYSLCTAEIGEWSVRN